MEKRTAATRIPTQVTIKLVPQALALRTVVSLAGGSPVKVRLAA